MNDIKHERFFSHKKKIIQVGPAMVLRVVNSKGDVMRSISLMGVQG